jgi:hypothetical protein
LANALLSSSAHQANGSNHSAASNSGTVIDVGGAYASSKGCLIIAQIVKYAGDDIAGTIGLTFCKRWAPKAQNCQRFKAFL